MHPTAEDFTRALMVKGPSGSSFKEGTDAPIELEPRFVKEHRFVDQHAVLKSNGDIVFQLFPRLPEWPRREQEARELITALVEQHFGSTEGFKAGYVPELKSWSILARGLSKKVSYNEAYHVKGFVDLVLNTCVELRRH